MSRAALPGFDGSRLRTHRQLRNFSIGDVAVLAGASIRAVQAWEAGTSAPEPRHAKQLAEAFGISVRDLTTLTENDIGLAELRAFHGLARTQFAQLAGISAGTLAHLEIGQRTPTEDQAERLARALESSPEYVITLCQRVRKRRIEHLQRAAQRHRSGDH